MNFYVANARFSNTPAGSEDAISYQPGDPIDDFDSWPDAAKRSLLGMNYVKFDLPRMSQPVVAVPVEAPRDADDVASEPTEDDLGAYRPKRPKK